MKLILPIVLLLAQTALANAQLYIGPGHEGYRQHYDRPYHRPLVINPFDRGRRSPFRPYREHGYRR